MDMSVTSIPGVRHLSFACMVKPTVNGGNVEQPSLLQ
jgi:hypothetical protein